MAETYHIPWHKSFPNIFAYRLIIKCYGGVWCEKIACHSRMDHFRLLGIVDKGWICTINIGVVSIMQSSSATHCTLNLYYNPLWVKWVMVLSPRNNCQECLSVDGVIHCKICKSSYSSWHRPRGKQLILRLFRLFDTLSEPEAESASPDPGPAQKKSQKVWKVPKSVIYPVTLPNWLWNETNAFNVTPQFCPSHTFHCRISHQWTTHNRISESILSHEAR